MQWQPGADIKGVTTVYPDIIPQYIPFDYDKLLSVESAKSKAKAASKGKPPATTTFTSFIDKISDLTIPPTLIVGVNEDTGALIEEANPSYLEWQKFLGTIETDLAPKVMEDPYIQPSVIAYMSRVKNQFKGLSNLMASTNELAKSYKEANKSGLYDLVNENSRYIESVKSGGDIFSYGQTSVSTPLDIRKQIDERFQQLPTEEREAFTEWKTSVAPLGEQLYTLPKESVEYRLQQKLQNTFNGMLGSEDIKNELNRQTNLKIHNYSLQWNKKSKAEKEAASTMTDSEYNERLTKLGNLQVEIEKLGSDPKNKEAVELLNKEYYSLQEDLYGKGGNIIVDSKGNLAKDLMADQIYKMKVSNLYKEFIGSGSYEVDKRGIDIASSFYLSDYIKKTTEKTKSKEDDSDGIFSQAILLDNDVPYNPMQSAVQAVEKSDVDKLYGTMPALTAQINTAIAADGVSSFVINKLEKTFIDASDTWKKSVIDILKKDPQTLATLLAVAEVNRKTKGFFQSGPDPVLKTYLSQNTSSVLKASSLDKILSWFNLADLNSVTETHNNPNLTRQVPSVYTKAFKQVEKDQTLMPNSLLFTSSTNSDKDPMKAFIGTINRQLGLDASAFLLENGVNLKAQSSYKDDDGSTIRKYSLVNNGTFGEMGYDELMSEIGANAKSAADGNKHANLFTALSILGSSKSVSRVNPAIITSLPSLISKNAKDVLLTKDGSQLPVKVSFSSGESGKVMSVNYRGNVINHPIRNNEDAMIKLANILLASIPSN